MKRKKFYKEIIMIFFIICFLCFGITSSKYYNSFVLSFDADIAKPIFTVDDNKSVEINAVDNIGKYEFSVKNFEDNIESDVPFEYTIEVISNTDQSIEYTLYKDGQIINLNQNKTDKIFLNNAEKIVHKYCLEIKYVGNASDNSQDIIQNVQVKIESEQKNCDEFII